MAKGSASRESRRRSAPLRATAWNRNQLAVLEHRLHPRDPRRPVAPQRGHRLASASAERRSHPTREPRLRLSEHSGAPVTRPGSHRSASRSWVPASALPRLFNSREQRAGTGAIESQSVRLSANSVRPARRSNDGQTILDPLSAAQELGYDLQFCRAPLRNRTVDLLLTINPRKVPSLQVGRLDLEKHEHTLALTSPGQALASTICHSICHST